MDINKILTADFLDLVFEGRNKEYGAYELRKTYNKRIKTGMIGMLGLTLLLSVGAILSNSIKKKQAEVIAVDLSLENVQDEKKPEPPPPPPPPVTSTSVSTQDLPGFTSVNLDSDDILKMPRTILKNH